MLEAQIRKLLKGIPVASKCVLVWEEEQADECDIADFREPRHRTDGIRFLQSTAPKLSQDCFSDLTVANVGRFARAPHYRWIDLDYVGVVVAPCLTFADGGVTCNDIIPQAITRVETQSLMEMPSSFFSASWWLRAQREQGRAISARLAEIVRRRKY